MQGHSTASTLPPLPENGPTVETMVQEVEAKGVDGSPLPSATTSTLENIVKEEVEEGPTEDPPARDNAGETLTTNTITCSRRCLLLQVHPQKGWI